MKNKPADFIEEIYTGSFLDNNAGYDKARAKRIAIKKVLPLIIDRELTERQRICLNYRYVSNKSQNEIAELLKLSQPTVSRHINAAKDIVNNKLQYCVYAASSAIESYDS